MTNSNNTLSGHEHLLWSVRDMSSCDL